MFALQLGRNHKLIFTIQDEPPTWPSDTDEFTGLESISEPDDMDMDDNDDEEEEAQSRSLIRATVHGRYRQLLLMRALEVEQGALISIRRRIRWVLVALGRLRGLRLRLGKVACWRLLMISVGRKMFMLATRMMTLMTMEALQFLKCLICQDLIFHADHSVFLGADLDEDKLVEDNGGLYPQDREIHFMG